MELLFSREVRASATFCDDSFPVFLRVLPRGCVARKAGLVKPGCKPSRILMLKGHSAGIGDLLRGSAAWRVLKNAYPESKLHLLFLTKDPGAASEALIRRHHLLDSFSVVDKRTEMPEVRRSFDAKVRAVTDGINPDLVIDFEPAGLRTSLMAFKCSWRYRSRTIGVSSVPGRGLFYSAAGPSPASYASSHHLTLPLEYTEKDFLALAPLGLERNGCPIELRETEDAREFRLDVRKSLGLPESARLLGLNIGCGTPDALVKRPDLNLLSQLVAGLQKQHGLTLLLMGAPFEREVNQEFIKLHKANSQEPAFDLAGETSILQLVGLINACELVVSSDSGPYHMAVALGVRTLAVFKFDSPTHFHSHPWVRCCLAPDIGSLPALQTAAAELMAWKPTQDRAV